jgi:putative membrane protein
MFTHRRFIYSAFVVGIASVMPLAAQQERQPPPPGGAAPSAAMERRAGSGDEMFASKAAAGGQAEVELAVMARQKASTDAVKQLADKIETDHKQANTELMSIVSAKGWKTSATPSGEHMALKSRLEKLDGAAFDRGYLDAMQKDHEKDIKAFQKQATSGTDPELKAFAEKTLPHLKAHLKMTMDAKRTMTTTSRQH